MTTPTTIFGILLLPLLWFNSLVGGSENLPIILTNEVCYPKVLRQKSSELLNIFLIKDLQQLTGRAISFVSLSDIYPLSEHKDSSAVPDLAKMKGKNGLKYFLLSEHYKKMFFAKTKISSKDSVFIYDYSTNQLIKLAVKELNVTAKLSDYRTVEDSPLGQYDYEIGFEISNNRLPDFNKGYEKVLVFVGKSNPFIKGKMKPLVWKKIPTSVFPLKKSNLADNSFKVRKLKIGNAYSYQDDHYQYFLQDLITAYSPFEPIERQLLVINKGDGKVVFQNRFQTNEGKSLAPLNYGIAEQGYESLKEQWTGTLFKGKPKVIFGFEWAKFGCPQINFLDANVGEIVINCDNRH